MDGFDSVVPCVGQLSTKPVPTSSSANARESLLRLPNELLYEIFSLLWLSDMDAWEALACTSGILSSLALNPTRGYDQLGVYKRDSNYYMFQIYYVAEVIRFSLRGGFLDVNEKLRMHKHGKGKLWTPLRFAMEEGDERLTNELLLDWGADMRGILDDDDDEEERKPLLHTVLSREYGYLVILVILDYLGDYFPMETRYRGETALHYMVRNFQTNCSMEKRLILDAFLRRGANPNIRIDNQGNTLLHLAGSMVPERGSTVPLTAALIKYGARIDKWNKAGKLPIPPEEQYFNEWEACRYCGFDNNIDTASWTLQVHFKHCVSWSREVHLQERYGIGCLSPSEEEEYLAWCEEKNRNRKESIAHNPSTGGW